MNLFRTYKCFSNRKKSFVVPTSLIRIVTSCNCFFISDRDSKTVLERWCAVLKTECNTKNTCSSFHRASRLSQGKTNGLD